MSSQQALNRQLEHVSASRTQNPQSLEIQLTHNPLPKLADEGLIEWERDTQTVSKGPTFETVEPALRVIAANIGKFPNGLLEEPCWNTTARSAP